MERQLLHALQYYIWQNEPEVLRLRWLAQREIEKAKREKKRKA